MVTLEIMQFVEQNILPRYTQFYLVLSLRHVNDVITASLKLARRLGADPYMAYVVAAYHDLGMEGPRAIHHITGGRILAADRRLARWFTPEQISIMREAVDDHRASASNAPRSIYGRIVAEADRQLLPDTVMRRTIEYGIDHYPQLSVEEHLERFIRHIEEKYSEHGYIRLWISGSDNERHLQHLRHIINTPHLLKQHFYRIWGEIRQDRHDGQDRQDNVTTPNNLR